MRYPIISLVDAQDRCFVADYPDEPQKGSFLEIETDRRDTRVRVDRFSTIPFYYTAFEGRLYGATKFSKLLKDLPLSFPRKLDRVAALQFIRTNSMLADRTLIEGIRQVPYGTELSWNGQKVTIRRYWAPPGEADHSMSSENALELLFESFTVAVEECCQGSDNMGMHLSGGMDSRQLLGAMLRSGRRFRTFTYGLDQSLDVLIAHRLAKVLNFEHIVEYWPQDSRFLIDADLHFSLTDGMQALFHGHGVHLHAQQSAMVTRMLHGHFLDLYMQGHMYNPTFDRGANRAIVRGRLYETFDGGPCSVIRGDSIENEMVAPDLRGAFRECVMQYIDDLSYMEPEKQYDSVYFFHHGLHRLLQQIQSGAHFVDYRLPGLHSTFFDFAWRVPASLRKHRGLQQQLLRGYYPQTVQKVPLVKDNAFVLYGGRSSLMRICYSVSEKLRRAGYLPRRYDYYGHGLEAILRFRLWEVIRKEILAPVLMEAEVVQPKYLRGLVDAVESNVEVPLGHIGALYTLSRFISTFVDKQDTSL